jgi:hypothetical protein
VADQAAPTEGFVVLASYENPHLAEQSVASLGRRFRALSRRGEADALVVTANRDGSLKVRESRALRAGNFTNVLVRLTLSLTAGFMGILASLKGVKQSGHAVRLHERHIGADEHEAHALLAEAGSRSALVLVRCNDEGMLNLVASEITKGAIASWQGSLSEFLAALEPGDEHDWVWAAMGKPSDSGP